MARWVPVVMVLLVSIGGCAKDHDPQRADRDGQAQGERQAAAPSRTSAMCDAAAQADRAFAASERNSVAPRGRASSAALLRKAESIQSAVNSLAPTTYKATGQNMSAYLAEVSAILAVNRYSWSAARASARWHRMEDDPAMGSASVVNERYMSKVCWISHN